MIPGAIMWCEHCGKRPADGILTVLRHGETEPEQQWWCQGCVNKLKPEDWIIENDLC